MHQNECLRLHSFVRQLRFIVHQNECLRLHSFRTRYIHMYFTRLRFITHLDCLSRASLFGNSALSCIKMNVYACILLERGIYTCTLFACALLRCLRQYIAWLSGSKKDREVAIKNEVCTHVLYSLALYYAFRLFVSCVVVRQLRFIVHQNECLRLHSFRTSYIHMYFIRLRFITLFAAVYRLVVRQQKRSRSCNHSRTATDRFRCDGS